MNNASSEEDMKPSPSVPKSIGKKFTGASTSPTKSPKKSAGKVSSPRSPKGKAAVKGKRPEPIDTGAKNDSPWSPENADLKSYVTGDD
jgi:hypothetical protein